MKRFSLRLRKILLLDIIYYLLLIISILFIIIYNKKYIPLNKYDLNDNNFILKIKTIKIDGNKLSLEFYDEIVGTYYFKTKDEKDNFRFEIGDTIYIKGILKLPNNNTIQNTFNYKKYLKYNYKNYILNIESYKLINKNKNIFLKLKNKIINKVNNIKNNQYLYAFILGKSSYIENEIYNQYKINGITHLFALSGLHVSLFSSIIIYILKKLKMNEKISLIITSIFLILFAFIASFTPSILRAVIYFILYNINKIYYFYIKPKYILYVTFTILIFINPFCIFNIGFILSFTITFFIILFNENFKINKKYSIIIISIISFLSSLPIIINLSYEINIIGFINNIFFIPFVSYLVFPISLLSFIFNKLFFILNFLIFIMEKVSYLSSKALNISLIFKKISLIEIIIYYLILISSIKLNKRLFLILLLYIVYLFIKPNFNSKMYVYFNDIGQGDSILILTENNNTILIDTGGKINYKKEPWSIKNKEFNQMIDSLIPFYKSLGIKKIDYLFITHGDTDHMGYSIDLIKNFKVKNVIFNCGESNKLELELINVLKDKKIKYYSCIKELNIDNINLKILNTRIYDNENDNSTVIYFIYNNYKFLFMGDSGLNKENDLINKYNLKNIDFLKVGHHGSNTSSSKHFIDIIKPKYSIISVGGNNRYGHPNKEVLKNLEDSKIYRTDKDGSIMFKIKNNKLKIETCSP